MIEISFGSIRAPLLPIAAIILPQFGSAPNKAVFTSKEFAIHIATFFASLSVSAPFTVILVTFVAPSPSLTTIMASSLITLVIASFTSAISASIIFDVSTKSVSFVDVSPSTEMALKLDTMAFFVIISRGCLFIFASVRTIPRVVAISGAIIPEPFAMPSTLALPAFAEHILGYVSVVIMACAKRVASGLNPSTRGAIFFMIFSAGSLTPITPVDSGMTSCCPTPSSEAMHFIMMEASFRPASPVHAFALPELATIALITPFLTKSTPIITGAAFTRFLVKAPETYA